MAISKPCDLLLQGIVRKDEFLGPPQTVVDRPKQRVLAFSRSRKVGGRPDKPSLKQKHSVALLVRLFLVIGYGNIIARRSSTRRPPYRDLRVSPRVTRTYSLPGPRYLRASIWLTITIGGSMPMPSTSALPMPRLSSGVLPKSCNLKTFAAPHLCIWHRADA